MRNHKCGFGDAISLKLCDTDIDPCMYRLMEIHKNVTVQISQCPNCGAIDISWTKQDDTESQIIEQIMEA